MYPNKDPLREFPQIRVPYYGILMIRILLLRVLYSGPLFTETPKQGSFKGYHKGSVRALCALGFN